MARFYILVSQSGVGTKEGEFFEEQGGLKESWGKAWEPVEATSLYDARNQGIALRRKRFPDSHRTMGEDGEAPERYWPEAAGQ